MRKSSSLSLLTIACAAALLVGLGAPAAAGTNAKSSAKASAQAAAREELLYLGSSSSLSAVAPATGVIRFQKYGAVPARDFSRLYAAEFSGGTSTFLNTLDPRTGAVKSTRALAGNLVVRAVSDDGAAVALMPPGPRGAVADSYHPQPRAQTSLVIARRGQAEPARITVQGNVEPEAFSRSAKSLFVVEFTPPEAPDRYRVARLDLVSGTLHDVTGYDDDLQEPMRGTARAQAMAPDGRVLYTLYTRNASETESATAFVHVLDLDRERATCIDLPPEFATSDLGEVAVTPSGARVYVVAPTVPAIAEIDTVGLRVTRASTLPPEIVVRGIARVTAANSATLYLGTDNQMTKIDLGTLAVASRWPLAGVVTGVRPAADQSSLYVSLFDRVLVLNPATGSTTRQFMVSGMPPIDHLAPALPPIVHQQPTVSCAC